MTEDKTIQSMGFVNATAMQRYQTISQMPVDSRLDILLADICNLLECIKFIESVISKMQDKVSEISIKLNGKF